MDNEKSVTDEREVLTKDDDSAGSEEQLSLTDSERAAKKIGKRRGFGLAIFALLFLVNGNLNIIDPLPDFICYAVLASLIGRAENVVPYLAECKSYLNKLTLISVIKLPAVALMFGNMSSGRDIIPLFTLVFSALELMLLLPAISNGFSALYYLGQRVGGAKPLIAPFAIGSRSMHPDRLRDLAYIFVIAKEVLSFLPELCNLTFGSAELMAKLRSVYTYLFFTCFIAVTAVGITVYVLAVKYLKSIKRSCSFKDSVIALAGSDKLAAIGKHARMRSYMDTVSVLLYSSLLSFDIQIDSYGEMVILPHFIYGIALIFVAYRLFARRSLRLWGLILSSSYSLLGLAGYLIGARFHDSYDFRDLRVNEGARRLYGYLEIVGVAETAVYLALCALLCIGLIEFTRRHTVVGEHEWGHTRQDAAILTLYKRKSVALFIIAGLAALVKLAKLFADGDVEMILTGADVVTASSLPWMGLACSAASLLFFAFSWYFLTDVRSDIEHRYSDDSYRFK